MNDSPELTIARQLKLSADYIERLKVQEAALGGPVGGSGVANQVAYFTGVNTIGGLTAVNDAVLITSGAGVPSLSTTIPLVTQGNITKVGIVTLGTWNAGVIGPAYGGTGVANNASSTLTISGAFGLTFTIAAARNVTIPATDTVAMLGVPNVFTANQEISKTGAAESLVNGTEGQTRVVIIKSAIVDNVATEIFSITTTNETGSNDGGAYVCNITALVGHALSASTSNDAVKKWRGSFSRIMLGAGTGVNTAIEDIFSGTSAATTGATRDIGTITVTVAETSEYENRVSFQIDLTGTSVAQANVIVIVELIYSTFTTRPVIAQL